MPRDYDDDDRPRRRRRDEEDDDDRPQARKRRYDPDEDDDEDRPRRRRKKKVEAQMSVLGLVALIAGILGLVLSLLPCLNFIGGPIALIGLILGIIGLVVAKKSEGRQSPALPVAGLSVSVVAIVIAVVWVLLIRKVGKDVEREEAEWAREEAEWKAQQAKEKAQAVKDVKAAEAGGGGTQVTAVELARAYDQNEDRADARFKNRVLEVTGVVKEVDFVNNDDAYAVLLHGTQDDTVDCEFAKDPAIRARLAQLKPGDTVTIRGKCTGGTILQACVLIVPAGE
jgi:hypothetical protein